MLLIPMATRKVAVTIQEDTLLDVDRWVKQGRFANRSRAVQAALTELIARRRRTRLVEELAKLDPQEERQLADEGLGDEAAWPEY